MALHQICMKRFFFTGFTNVIIFLDLGIVVFCCDN